MALDPVEFAAAMATYLAATDLSIALRRGTAANKPAGLLAGEPYFATDTGSLFIGIGAGLSKEYPTPITGSFTPTIRFGGASTGVTYTTQAGTYYRIGKLIVFQLAIVLTSKGSATGNLEIGGLPFNNAQTPVPVAATVQKITYPATVLQLICRFNGAARNYLNFFGQVSGGAFVTLTDAHVANDSVFSVFGAYEAA